LTKKTALNRRFLPNCFSLKLYFKTQKDGLEGRKKSHLLVK
jgi:hypothetical protein